MNNFIRSLNKFFISEDGEASRHDALWFYGSIALMMFMVMIVMISNLLTKY